MRRLLFVLFLLFGRGASAAEPTLLVVSGGHAKSYNATQLLKRPDAVPIEVNPDVTYGRKMSYHAVPLAALLPLDRGAKDSFFEVKSLDGFVSQLPGQLVVNRDPGRPIAMLAVEDPVAPWPVVRDHQTSAGPFYIVWIGGGVSAIRTEQWPYQVASITEAASPVNRWPQLAVAATIPRNAPVRQGQALFLTQCLACHKLAGGGESEVGPDLAFPMSPTEYFTPAALRKFLRDPASLRDWPGRKMPAFGPNALSENEIDLIILYLQRKARTN